MDDTTRKSGTQNEIEGAAKELGGKIRKNLGDLTDNHSEEFKGKRDELKGKAQKNLGDAQQEVEDLDRNL